MNSNYTAKDFVSIPCAVGAQIDTLIQITVDTILILRLSEQIEIAKLQQEFIRNKSTKIKNQIEGIKTQKALEINKAMDSFFSQGISLLKENDKKKISLFDGTVPIEQTYKVMLTMVYKNIEEKIKEEIFL